MAKKKTEDVVANPAYINKVTLRGTIIRKYAKDNWMVMSIVTNPKTGGRDYPSVFWYGEQVKEINRKFSMDDHVEITANIVTSKVHRSQSIVGEKIEMTKRELEEKMGIKGIGRLSSDENEVLLKGDLVKLYSPPASKNKCTIATLYQKVGRRTFYPQVVLFGDQKKEIEKFAEGTPVCVVGHVQTQVKSARNSRTFFESIVGHYIVSE